MNLALLKSTILAIAESRSLTDVLGQIVSGIAEVSDTALARVWLLQSDSECPLCSKSPAGDTSPALHLVASAGRSKSGRSQTRTDGRSHKIRIGERKIGRIAQTREALLVDKVTPDLPWVADPEWIAREEIRSFAGQSLVCRGELLGVLAVFSRARLSSEDFAWLRTFADHAAVAIWNARAFEELHRLRTQLQLENESLQDEVKEALDAGGVLGQSNLLKDAMRLTNMVAPVNVPVLILGETGTGKELVARAIHERGARRTRPFIKVNCGAIPENLFESEFFGHVKGAFTGAVKDRVGRFESADGGDLFLDEVGELPPPIQVKLLRALQEKQFERVGEDRTRSVDVRIIAATNRDLKKEVALGRFREDLYFRLAVVEIRVPPLRERAGDIPLLAAHFLKTRAAQLNIKPLRIAPAQMAALSSYPWPGNVRELENVMERALILSQSTGRLEFDLPSELLLVKNPLPPTARADTLIETPESRRQNQRRIILAALQKANGKIFGPKGAAAMLNLKPTTLASKIKALKIKKQFI